MVSKNEIKLITSLAQKKYRNKHQLFVAEGVKIVEELVNSQFEIYQIYTINDFNGNIDADLLTRITLKDLQKISQLKNPNTILGVFKIPRSTTKTDKGLQLVLDGIKDPGNLGTIIRLCDWFGVAQLICSNDTVDCYNPKVVQATMGSLSRVNIVYTDIESYLNTSKLPIYITMLEGDNLYQENLPKNAIIVMGNEANGISESIQKLANYTLSIPRFGVFSKAESLNVAMATTVFLNEFRR
jgi:TrmH family RNA methyltransferase